MSYGTVLAKEGDAMAEISFNDGTQHALVEIDTTNLLYGHAAIDGIMYNVVYDGGWIAVPNWSVQLSYGCAQGAYIEVCAGNELDAKKEACKLWGMPNSYTHPYLRATLIR